MEKQNELVTTFVIIFLTLTSIIGRIFATLLYWNWVVSPVTGLSQISFLHAFALSQFFAIFSISVDVYLKPSDNENIKRRLHEIKFYIISIVLGYILTFFI